MSNRNILGTSLKEIEHSIQNKLSVDEMAHSAFLSKYHYQRVFREIVGENVMEYIKKRKLSLAGKDLINSDATVLDIALRFGYSSHESFTRAFKAYMGVTPAEYRKYCLSSIYQKQFDKEMSIMQNIYTKNTDEIIRGLNEFIAQSKRTAEFAVKNGVPEYMNFWRTIAAKTNIFADRLQKGLGGITTIAVKPDEITNRFDIIKMIEDVSLFTNILAFNVNLFVARGTPEQIEKQKPICERYTDLAQSSAVKINTVSKLFNELASLIYLEMKKSALEKIAEIVKVGGEISNGINGYKYITEEINAIVYELSTLKYEQLTAAYFDYFYMRIEIISFTAAIDVTRSPADEEILMRLHKFSDCINEAKNFFVDFVKPETNPNLERNTGKLLSDIAYQSNILYFYTKGEVSDEKLGKLLSAEQKVECATILKKIDELIVLAMHSSKTVKNDERFNSNVVFIQIGNALREIGALLLDESRKLGDIGGAVAFLANEYNCLSESVMQAANK